MIPALSCYPFTKEVSKLGKSNCHRPTGAGEGSEKN